MGAVAGLRAIRTAGIDPDDIDLILLATLTPDYWMPSTAALVKEAIGNTRAAAMDVAAACSGFVYGYATAAAYIQAGLARHVLVIGAELLTRFLDYSDRSTCILFGDGAGAVVLSASDEPGGALGIELTTEPQGAYMIWLPAGGAKSPPSAETIARGEHFIRMEGRETYRFATRTLASTALAAASQAGLTSSDVDLFIPHQANIRIIEAVAKGLDLPMSKFFVNLDRYGNTSAASVPMALAEAVNEGHVGPGDRIVMVAFGAGFTSGRSRSSGPPTRLAGGPAMPPSGRRTSSSVRPSTGIPSIRSRPPSPTSSPAPSRPASASRSTTSPPASPNAQSTPSRSDRPHRQDGARHGRVARSRSGDRPPPGDAGRRRRAQLPRQRGGGERNRRGDREARSSCACGPGRRP